MKSASVFLAFGFFIVPFCSLAEQPINPKDLNNPEVDARINTMIECAGFLDFMSEDMKSAGKPANAKFFLEQMNGSEIAAAYLMYMQWQSIHFGDKSKNFDHFMKNVKNRAEVSRTRMEAIAENLDSESVTAQGKECMKIAPLVSSIMNVVRRQVEGLDVDAGNPRH